MAVTTARSTGCARGGLMVDPFDRATIGDVLAGLAARVEAGTPLETVRTELFEMLWPWARRYAERVARRLPVGADADETRSHLLSATWEAARRFEPDLAGGWPSLLRLRLEGARIDAARRDDVVSRRHRRALAAAAALEAAAEQGAGRHLRSVERDALAEGTGARPGGITGTGPFGYRATTATGTLPDVADEREDLERRIIDAELQMAVRAWIDDDLPADVSARLTAWWRHETSRGAVPARLADQLRPYLHRLVPLMDPAA